jgi:metallophosphoesterase superfamily enzyme
VLLGVLFVDLCGERGLTVEGPHLLVDVLAVVVGHFHPAVKVVKCAVRHFKRLL